MNTSIERSVENIRNDLRSHQDEDAQSFGNIEKILALNTEILSRHDKEFQDMKHAIEEMKMMIRSIAEESKPVNLWFSNITFGKRILIGSLGIIGAIVAIILGIKNIISV